MTRLTVHENPGEEFTVRGHNTVTEMDDDEIVFYRNVIKVRVVPEPKSFTIQVITPDLVVEMDFANADSIRQALGLFGAKKVSEVHPEAPCSVRIVPSSSETAET